MYRSNTVENTADTRHVPTVVDRVPCVKHGRTEGQACWHINTVGSFKAPAVCNDRAVSAGMNHPVSETAFLVKSRKRQ